MAGIIRNKKYELEWDFGDRLLQQHTVEQIDEMFRDLFEDLRNGSLFPVDLASDDDVDGILGVEHGGTGLDTYTIGDLLYASAATVLSKLADVATGNALISGGVATAPSWGKIGLTTHVSGVLPIANGGTNATATPTLGGSAYGTGSAYAFTAAGTSGQVLTSNGASAPTWQDATGGIESLLTNGDPTNPELIFDSDGDVITIE